MKKKVYWLLVLVLASGVLLSACNAEEVPVAPQAAEAVVAEPVEEGATKEAAVEEAGGIEEVAEPAEEEKEMLGAEQVVMATHSDLDAALAPFLASMIKYNITSLMR